MGEPGWMRRGALHDRLLPLDLGALDEGELLPPSGRATLYSCGRDATDYDPRREPVVLIHGLTGGPGDLAALSARITAATDWQVHVLAYQDVERPTRENGDALAEELNLLGNLGDGERTLRIVAHSLGGLVLRRALGRMAQTIGLERWERVRAVCVDNPWQGFGAGNATLDGAFYRLVSGMLPGGIADMHVGSTMFRGDPASRDPVERAGLFGVRLPDEVELHLVFALGGGPATNWTRPEMAPLLEALVGRFTRDSDVTGTPEQRNFWAAIRDSAQFGALAATLRAAGEARQLDVGGVRRAFDELYPRFGGDHSGCLREQPAGAPSLPSQIVDLLM